MNVPRTTVLFAVMVALFATLAATASGHDEPGHDDLGPARSAPVVVLDERGDVGHEELDIRRVEVRNRPDALTVRVRFPGVAETYDFPTGAVSVFLDTDPARRGAEYGHFMDFWSEHRFAEVDRWREQPTPEWGHAPEGRCVATAGVRSDRQSRLRWFEYVVSRAPGCFEADAVRVAVSTVNTGDLEPYVEYPRPAHDHLTARHAWTAWVPVAG